MLQEQSFSALLAWIAPRAWTPKMAVSIIGPWKSHTSRHSRRSVDRSAAAWLEHELSRRGRLYKDFILSAPKAYGDAMVRNEPEIPVMVDLYAMISVMRMVSSARTLECAEIVMNRTAQTYFESNISALELHQQVKEAKGIDPLKEFSEAARAALRSLTPM